MRRKIVSAALVLALLAALIPPPASATMAVYDYVNWLQALAAWYQRYQQIVHQYDQLVALRKQIESFGDGGYFNTLKGTFADLDALFREEDNFGYLHPGVQEVFDESFPGYEKPVSWPDEVSSRMDRTRETLSLIVSAMNRLTYANTRSQEMTDAIIAQSRVADSPLEELEVISMWNGLAVTEQQRSLQAQLLTANSVTLAAAVQMQREAAGEAARSAWLAQEAIPVPGHDASEGFTGIPDSWPWRF